MCIEVFEDARILGLETLEIQLILQCAPVIAGIKMANLLIIPLAQAQQMYDYFQNSEISVFCLLEEEGKGTFLLYRRKMLEPYFGKKEVRKILIQAGYQNFSFSDILSLFRIRFENCRKKGDEFPHEMGVLLGYPTEDVEGFIKQKGKNFLYSGCWKVYENLPEKLRLFHKYEAARRSQVRLLSKGVRMEEIINIYQKEELQQAAI